MKSEFIVLMCQRGKFNRYPSWQYNWMDRRKELWISDHESIIQKSRRSIRDNLWRDPSMKESNLFLRYQKLDRL